MSVWSKLLTAGGKMAGVAKTGTKATMKSMGEAVIHPTHTLTNAGKAVKTATMGGAVGYVGWALSAMPSSEKTQPMPS